MNAEQIATGIMHLDSNAESLENQTGIGYGPISDFTNHMLVTGLIAFDFQGIRTNPGKGAYRAYLTDAGLEFVDEHTRDA